MSEPPPPEPAGFDVERSVAGWVERLAGVGGPNSLLWLDPDSPLTLDLSSSHPAGVAKLLSGRPTRLGELVRERQAHAAAHARAAAVRARVSEVREDTGLLTGFLGAGLATWTMPRGVRPCAPVLLRRCLLTPVDAAESDFDIDLAPDLEINPALLQYLRVAHGLDLDSQVLAAMAVNGSAFDPAPVLAQLRRLCAGVAGFAVTPGLVVAPFSLAKHSAVLDVENVDRGHPLVLAAAAAEHARAAGTLAGEDDAQAPGSPGQPGWKSRHDPSGDPGRRAEVLVLDADARQHEVVARVLDGRDVAVHAPVGTGATQTVANVVAAAVGAGRTVILAAATEDDRHETRRRLESVGLGGLLLEVREGAECARRLHEEVVRRAAQAVVMPAPAGEDDESSATRARLLGLRDRLAAHRATMHEPRSPWGVSLARAHRELAALAQRTRPPVSRVRLPARVLESLPLPEVPALAFECTRLASLGAWGPRTAEDPWFGAQVDDEEEAARCLAIATGLSGGRLAGARAALDSLTERAGLPPARTLEEAHERLELLADVHETLEVFTPQLFDAPLVELVASTAPGEGGGVLGRARARRQTRRLLRPGTPPADVRPLLVAAIDQRRRWIDLAGTGTRPSSPPGLADVRGSIRSVLDDVGWLQARLSGTIGGDDLFGAGLDDLAARLDAMAAHGDRVDDLPVISRMVRELRRRGLGALIDDLARRSVRPDDVGAEVHLVWWASVLEHEREQDGAYGEHDGPALRELEQAYQQADHEHQAAVARAVLAGPARRLRQVAQEDPAQLRALERAAVQAPWSIAQWVEQAPDVLAAVAPVLVVAPMAAGAVLPRAEVADLVVLEGADRLPMEQAVPVLSRAQRAVVIGDPGSPGPAPFSVAGAPAPATAQQLVSALDVLALAWGRPVELRTLWGLYDERLSHVVNARLHDGRLVAAPAPGGRPAVEVVRVVEARPDPQEGLEGHTVPTTAAEVEAVLGAVLRHLEKRPDESLAVVAATRAHASRVREALLGLLAGGAAGPRGAIADSLRAALCAALAAEEPLVVVPLARAGSLVRDAVVVTTGCAPGPDGEVLDHGGLLEGPGSERWVARALTRSRRHTCLVTGWEPEYLAELAEREGAEGARLLSAWVEAAGAVPAPAAPGARSPLDDEFVRRLEGEGLRVVADHGLGPRRIPLAVTGAHDRRGPVVAVLTDDERWAAVESTRERDRLWPEHLARLGWRVVRVYGTDVFRDPARDAVRVAQALLEVENGGR